jgi:outer membrane DcaP-like protein
MKGLMRQVWRQAIAGLLVLAGPSAVLAQQADLPMPIVPLPPAPPTVVQSSSAAAAPPSTTSSLPTELPQLTGPMGGNSGLPSLQPAQPTSPKGLGATDSLPTIPTTPKSLGSTDALPLRTQTTTQPPPIIGSQPPPFQITPDTPPAAQDPGFYAGNRPIQDLSSLVTGNFRDTKYKWYGFVRLDAIYDFRPMASTDSFVTSAIPVPQGRGQNFVMTPRYTRFGFDTETPLKVNDWTLKTRIEMDFFNGNTSGLFGSFPLRLRFAWADFGPFLIGQAASLFMDYDVFPNVLDYQGPGGMVLMRQPIAAIHFPVFKKAEVSFGVEQPYSDIQWNEGGGWILNPQTGIITTPGVGRNVQDFPDVTGNVRYEGDYGHMQAAGILRKLTFQPGPGDSALDELGYGFNLTGTFHPWACLHGIPRSGECASPLSKSRFLYQFAAGHGINRYIQDVNGLGLDATFDAANGFRTIPSYGWFVAYEHWWTKRLISNFTYGQNACDLTDTLPGSTYERANYVSANIIWLPMERMGVGLEYLYGFRKNKDGQKGDNTRIQAGFQYRF